jgi:Zn-dependent membrane protease YugP
MIGYMIIIGGFTLVGMLVSGKLKSTFNKYGKVALRNGMTGQQVAHAMLAHYGINDVKVVPGKGSLTDHYNPLTKTIALSEPVFNSNSISAAAVAAHECGHAVQHATAYPLLTMRSRLVPVIQFSSKVQSLLMMGFMFGLMGTGLGGGIATTMMYILAATFGATALFSLVTLPVEFDASKRALAWLDNANVTQGAEYDGAKEALWWAAMTYVTQALSSLAMFLYFLLRALSSD